MDAPLRLELRKLRAKFAEPCVQAEVVVRVVQVRQPPGLRQAIGSVLSGDGPRLPHITSKAMIDQAACIPASRLGSHCVESIDFTQ